MSAPDAGGESRTPHHHQSRLVMLIRIVLSVALGTGIWTAQWSLSFVALATLVAIALPPVFARRFSLVLPISFSAAIALFLFMTLFLGEAFDFYERYWWWDVVLHTGSAIGFGLVGFLFVFTMFKGTQDAVPPIVFAIVTMCLAISIGTVWEIFEFAMDQIFGLTMQKSGLVDTMWDLIVNLVGASVGSAAGFAYLKGRRDGGLVGSIRDFLKLNKRD